uniref:Pathogenesis-related maize seed protein n=1 Tax=Zea mays subsp. parviglumis TaxID=76912 RepID=B8QWR7_ZEAMP|nr:pathogenesis-related maize seed protein [Zea mays subsp. parviglumis]
MEASNKLAVLLLWLVMAATTAVHPSYSENSPQDYLTPQNSARAAVGVGPAIWSTKLQQFAEKYAAQRASDCRLQHSGGPYGENIFWGSAGFDWKAADAVRSWVDEKQWYKYATNSCAAGKVCGHYTQVVWRATTSIGCARVVCRDNRGVFIICNYEPRGNIAGMKPY